MRRVGFREDVVPRLWGRSGKRNLIERHRFSFLWHAWCSSGAADAFVWQTRKPLVAETWASVQSARFLAACDEDGYHHKRAKYLRSGDCEIPTDVAILRRSCLTSPMEGG
jgi:hypothetical protein